MGELQTIRRTDQQILEADHLVKKDLYSGSEIVDRSTIEWQARMLLADRGEVDVEYKTGQTYHDDARTALFEALTASGHLSLIELEGPLEEIHGTMLSVLVNAYSDDLPAKERSRRFQELCSELTRQEVERRIASGELPSGVQVAEVSDFIEGINTATAQDLGYRPSNQKGMLRSSWLVDNHNGTFKRVSEQISRSNAEAARTESFLRNEGVWVKEAKEADVRVLGTTLIHDMSEGVVGLMRRLDAHHGVGIRYGEAVNNEHPSYESLRSESRRRERQAECFVQQLADYTQQIDKYLLMGEIGDREHQEMLGRQIREILRAICTMCPEYAKDCFGEAASHTYHEASNRAAMGDAYGASVIIKEQQHLESVVSFCGMTISSTEAKEKGLQSSSLESLIATGIESWGWKRGICRVDACPTKPGKTDVGPCSVCRGCQAEFDRGRNPAQTYRTRRRAGRRMVKAAQGQTISGKVARSDFRFFDFTVQRMKDRKKLANREKMSV